MREQELTKDKYYKSCPKHHFWINDGNIEKITPLSRGLNHWESIDLDTHKRTGAYIHGYLLKSGAKKAAEDDFKSALNTSN